jgi:hypothetical protein
MKNLSIYLDHVIRPAPNSISEPFSSSNHTSRSSTSISYTAGFMMRTCRKKCHGLHDGTQSLWSNEEGPGSRLTEQRNVIFDTFVSWVSLGALGVCTSPMTMLYICMGRACLSPRPLAGVLEGIAHWYVWRLRGMNSMNVQRYGNTVDPPRTKYSWNVEQTNTNMCTISTPQSPIIAQCP